MSDIDVFEKLVIENLFILKFVDFNNLRLYCYSSYLGLTHYIKIRYDDGFFNFNFTVDDKEYVVKSENISNYFTQDVLDHLLGASFDRYIIEEFLEQGSNE